MAVMVRQCKLLQVPFRSVVVWQLWYDWLGNGDVWSCGVVRGELDYVKAVEVC